MEQEEIEIQVWEYIDGNCTPADEQRIARLVAEDTVWGKVFGALSSFHTDIAANMELEQPSLRFTKGVMEAVSTQQVAPVARRYVNKRIVKGIAAFFIVTIAAMLIYGFVAADWSLGSLTGYSNVDVYISSIFNSTFFNLFIMVNIVLGLVLLDSALRKRGQYMS